MGHALKSSACVAIVGLAAALAPTGSFAKNITLTFDEVDFGTNGNIVDPLPNDAYAAYGILMSNFYWGTDIRDPFGGAQSLVAGKAATIPRISFLRDTPFIEFQFWTVGPEWEIYIQAFDDGDNEVGTFIGGGYWTTSFPTPNGGAEGKIVGPKIDYMTVLCREAASGISFGCGAVALSTLNFVRAPEPGSLALLALGLVGLGFTARRRLDGW